jgi:CTP:phosphocholine cytidylyltransferase-like protein
LAFYLILQGLKCKIKRSEIYFDEKCDLSTCVKTRDYNVLLSFYHYLQDNLYLQDNDSYLLSNLILNQIQTSKKRISLIETLFLTHEGTLAL